MSSSNNAQVILLGTPKTLEASGGSITNNSVVQADDATYDRDSDGAGYPDAEFYLTCAFGTGPTEGTTLVLMARPLDIDSTNDAEVPELARPTAPIGRFVVNNVTTTQYIQIYGGYVRDVPKKAEYYLGNDGTGQTVSSGWKLVVVPRTRTTAA